MLGPVVRRAVIDRFADHGCVDLSLQLHTKRIRVHENTTQVKWYVLTENITPDGQNTHTHQCEHMRSIDKLFQFNTVTGVEQYSQYPPA